MDPSAIAHRAKLFKILGIVGVMVFSCSGIGWYFGKDYYDMPAAASELDAEVIKAQQLGMPLEVSALRSKPPIAPADNAFPLITALRKRVEKEKLNNVISKLQTEVAGKDPNAGVHLAEVSGILEELRAAARMPGFDIQADFDIPAEIEFPHFSTIKTGVKFLCVNAEYLGQQGKLDEALNDLHYSYRLADFAVEEPCPLIGMLVYVANRSIIDRSTLKLVEINARNSSALEKIRQFELKHPYHNYFAATMKTESYYGLAITRNIDLYGLRDFMRSATNMGASDEGGFKKLDPAQVQRTGFSGSRTQRAFLARHLQLWNSLWPELMDPKADVVKVSGKIDTLIASIEQKKGLSYVLCRILFPVFSQSGIASLRSDAQGKARMGLIEALLYKNQTGKLPKTLAEAGYNELDPFTGKPLVILNDGKFLRVYSLGPDKTDNKGLSREELRRATTTNTTVEDVTATYPVVTVKKP